jgi:hypothetical protein
MEEIDESAILRVELKNTLPCGMGDCGKPASWAVVEQGEEQLAGLWLLLPVCKDCDTVSHLPAQTTQIPYGRDTWEVMR